MEQNPYESPRISDPQVIDQPPLEIPFRQAAIEGALWLALIGFVLTVWLS